MSSAAATLYVRDGTCFVTAMDRSIEGFWFESEPVFVENGVDFMVLSSCVQRALAASKTDVPAPRRDKLGSRLPGLAGVKSFGAFMKGAVSVDISSDGEKIKLTPMKNGGARNGFAFKIEESIIVDSVDQLALSLASALAVAE
jgi:hypothetical protein